VCDLRGVAGVLKFLNRKRAARNRREPFVWFFLCDLSLAWGLSRMFQHSGAGLFYLDHSLVRNAMRPIFVKCPVMNGTGVTGSSSQRPLGINPGRPWSFHGAISDAGAARPIWGVGYSDRDKSNLWAALSHGALSLLAA
jgi:hypothetical protein